MRVSSMLTRFSPLLLRSRPASSARAFASTYDFDRLYDTNHLDLPRLPIPSLDATLDAYITSLAPLVEDAADLARHTEAVEAFRVGEGPALDAELKRRDAAAAAEGGFPHFYFEKTWDEGYLGLSCSNVINVSPSLHLVAAPDGDTNQASRAARFVSATARWLTKARAGELVSDGLCMSQLGRLLGTARIPKDGCDELTFHASASRHIVVQCANEFCTLSWLVVFGAGRAVRVSKCSVVGWREQGVKVCKALKGGTSGQARIAKLGV